MDKLTFERRGLRTWVFYDGRPIGRIERREVSDSSPRGGAYRTAHFAIAGMKRSRDRGVQCYTRKEAAEWILQKYLENK